MNRSSRALTILVAPDKFKGSLTARQVCSAIEEGLLLADPSCNVISAPLADGGEGTCELLTAYAGGSEITAAVLDPLFREITTAYGISGDGQTAFVEMARASGLQLLKTSERNPMETSSMGTGQLIADALRQGATHVVVGIGGSATNDAGTGMAAALGFRFRSESGEILKPIGRNLVRICDIDKTEVLRGLFKTTFTFLSDVTNPLFGPTGAAFVFGPQKGANAFDTNSLDEGLRNFSSVALRQLGVDCNFAGAGAAGGAGAGAKVFFNAQILNGFDFVSAATKLGEKIQQADLVVTGEGKIDRQSLSGKVVAGVATSCQKNRKKCIAFAGRCELSSDDIRRFGIDQVHALASDSVSDEAAIRNAYVLLREKARAFLETAG